MGLPASSLITGSSCAPTRLALERTTVRRPTVKIDDDHASTTAGERRDQRCPRSAARHGSSDRVAGDRNVRPAYAAAARSTSPPGPNAGSSPLCEKRLARP